MTLRPAKGPAHTCSARLFPALLLVLLATADTATASDGTVNTQSPLRVTIQLEPAEFAAERLGRTVVEAVAKGLSREMPKGRVKIVAVGEPADIAITVKYLSMDPTEKSPPSGKEGRSKMQFLRAVVAGREVQATYTGVYTWQVVGESLGRDIAVVLSRTGSEPSVSGSPAELDVLVQQLRDRDPVRRAEAAGRLRQRGAAAASAAGALARLLTDMTPLRVVGPGLGTTVAGEAAQALVAIGRAETLLEFVRSDANGFARAVAFRTYVRANPAGARDVIVSLLDDDSRDVRQEAAALAGPLGEKRAIPKLIERVGKWNEHVHVRDAARASLVTLTRQDFGRDGDKWRAWLASQGGR